LGKWQEGCRHPLSTGVIRHFAIECTIELILARSIILQTESYLPPADPVKTASGGPPRFSTSESAVAGENRLEHFS
jgi:hypothetical protein